MSVLYLCDGDSWDGTCFDQSSIFSHEVVHRADTLLDYLHDLPQRPFPLFFPLTLDVELKIEDGDWLILLCF